MNRIFDLEKGYEVYHVDNEKFFALDPANTDLIEKELFNRSYMGIPEDKEVECLEFDYDK